MPSWFQALWTPRAEDPRVRRRESLLYILTLSALAASMLWLLSGAIAILLTEPHPRLLGDIYVGLEGIIFASISYLAARRGWLVASSYLCLFGLLMMQVSSMLLIWKSPLDPTMVFYALVIALGGLLLGRRVAVSFYVISLLCYLGTASWLFLQGKRVVEVKQAFTLGMTTLALAIILSILLLVVHFYIRSMEEALDRAEDEVRERTSKLEAACRELAEQHARLDVILHNVADGLVVTDLEERIVLANPAFATIAGRSAAELPGHGLDEVSGSAVLGRIADQARKEPGDIFVANVTLGQRVYQAVACALGGQDIPLRGVVTVLHDITQEVEALEARTQFVSTVAHELRVPLSSIRGYADLLAADVGPRLEAEQRLFLDAILQNVERMATLVHDLLDLCRLESGWVRMDIGPASLRNAIAEVLMAVRPQLDAKRLKLDVFLPPDLPFVLADMRRLNQILANLLSNACWYTLEGGCISIRARFLPLPQSDPQRYPRSDQDYVEVAIQDTGVGIAPQDKERIFERFVRLANPLLEETGGTGLGLTIVQQLLLLQGGQIWVESTLGQGSTFTFSLPAVGDDLAG